MYVCIYWCIDQVFSTELRGWSIVAYEATITTTTTTSIFDVSCTGYYYYYYYYYYYHHLLRKGRLYLM